MTSELAAHAPDAELPVVRSLAERLDGELDARIDRCPRRRRNRGTTSNAVTLAMCAGPAPARS